LSSNEAARSFYAASLACGTKNREGGGSYSPLLHPRFPCILIPPSLASSLPFPMLLAPPRSLSLLVSLEPVDFVRDVAYELVLGAEVAGMGRRCP